jgi:hypothetical protein
VPGKPLSWREVTLFNNEPPIRVRTKRTRRMTYLKRSLRFCNYSPIFVTAHELVPCRRYIYIMDPLGWMEPHIFRTGKDKGNSSFLFLYSSKTNPAPTGRSTCSDGAMET